MSDVELPTASDLADFAVVGTDTGVGKTVITAGLVGWLREAGVAARGIKPVQTGYPPDDDAGFVADACGDDDTAVCLDRLEPPLAPAVAADETGTELRYDEILAGCEAAVRDSAVGVVEGIGGLRVPLAGDREVVDLVADLGVPAVVVARSGLGTLNHSALTVEALERRGCRVQGIVLDEYERDSLAARTNPAVLADMTDCPVWTVPPIDLTDPGEAVRGVRDAVPAAVFPTE